MTEHVEKYTNKAIEIIADYILRTNKKNEQLQETKVRLDKKIALFVDDENCNTNRLVAVFLPAMTSHTRDCFFEEIAAALEGADK
ncbi:hypothetical protein [Klebsiella aerogenes]|uniref:hypothetical protein n=1 Tax=Klebsiella aerogenes TaxID=548 RepID=UPI00063C9463|nr:hypothetical protein [Klebsiella aerogenes]KLF44609.1 hypothetical protein YA32_06245 [Klebsiella aerogenes]